MAGRLEDHLEMVRREMGEVVDDALNEGVIVPSMVCGLVQIAREIAKRNSDIIGDTYFEESVADILAGGEGLHVGNRGKS